MHAGIHTPWMNIPPGQTHPSHPGQTPPAQCMLGYTHPPRRHPPVPTTADDMHSTGMHSCLNVTNTMCITVCLLAARFRSAGNL